MLTGRRYDEAMVLRTAAAFENRGIGGSCRGSPGARASKGLDRGAGFPY